MPIYEFRCEACGSRFEALVAAGAVPACRECGAPGTRRLYSPPAAPFRLARTGGEMRRQERRNEQLGARTKARFKRARERARGSDGKR